MGKIKKSNFFKSGAKKDSSFAKKVQKIKTISTPVNRINRKIISKKEKQKLKKQKVLDGIKNTKKKFAEDKAQKKRGEIYILISSKTQHCLINFFCLVF